MVMIMTSMIIKEMLRADGDIDDGNKDIFFSDSRYQTTSLPGEKTNEQKI